MFEQSHPEVLQPATPDEFLPPLSKWTTLGGVISIAFMGVAIALFAVLKYKVAVRAPATIRPVGEVRIVQSAIDGTIEEIAVQDNQRIEKGDIVAYMDDSHLQTQKNKLQGNIQQLTVQLETIDAQLLAIDNQITAESDRLNRTVSSARSELKLAQREFQDRQITTSAEVDEARAILRQSQEELPKLQANLKSAEANLKSTAAALNAAMKKRDRYQPLVESGSIALDQFEEVQLAVEQQAQALESQKAIIDREKQAIAQQTQAIEAARARVRRTLATTNPSNASVERAGESVAREKAAGNATLARLDREREAIIQQKVEIQNQLDRDRQELQQVETELQQTVLRASTSGTIYQMNLRNNFQVVQKGETIAKIVPSDTPLVIKADVDSASISKIEIGQNVQLRVSACPYPEFGTLKGKVSAISPDVMVSEGDRAATNFEVTVQPERFYLTAGERSCKIQPGMEGRADIISREQTVLAFILRKARLLADR